MKICQPDTVSSLRLILKIWKEEIVERKPGHVYLFYLFVEHFLKSRDILLQFGRNKNGAVALFGHP
jgi:hypothetical protein